MAAAVANDEIEKLVHALRAWPDDVTAEECRQAAAVITAHQTTAATLRADLAERDARIKRLAERVATLERELDAVASRIQGEP